jgi:hypothetical protein
MIHLDPNMVPAAMRGSYTGRKFKAEVCETVTIPITAGLWDGGSRELYSFIRLADGAQVEAPGQHVAPWDRSRNADRTVTIEPGYAVVKHAMFCGQDSGLTFYVHPDNAAKLLPAKAELTEHEQTVLNIIGSYKSSYRGEYLARAGIGNVDEIKASLISKGMLDSRGALTVAGKNARRFV